MRKNHPAYLELIESWRGTSLKRPPYVHKDDRILFSPDAKGNVCIYKDVDEYIRSEDFGAEKERKLHLGLLPVPYSGNLSQANVFILMLNPGLSNPNLAYYIQQHDGLQNSLAGIYQDGFNKKYPLGGLNPSLMWRSNYWRSKLDDIVRLAMEKRQMDYRRALTFVAQRVAVLQLYPYRSANFGLPRRTRRELRSSQLIVNFVRACLLPEAESGKVLIVVTRKAKSWHLHPKKNVIVYDGPESRSAHLSLKSRGGKAIAKHLDLQ